jgi:hypothetical protein
MAGCASLKRISDLMIRDVHFYLDVLQRPLYGYQNSSFAAPCNRSKPNLQHTRFGCLGRSCPRLALHAYPREATYSTCLNCPSVCPSDRTITQDLSILFRFSLRFTRSTRLLCIFSSIAAYRTRSSLAVRLVRIFSIRTCSLVSLWSFSMPILHTTHTCRAASFSSFISFSFAFMAA